jgi:hypothetical protein
LQLHDYSLLAVDNKKGIQFAGISYFPTPEEIFGDDIVYTTTVESDEHYRPDKVADRLWNIPDLNWILDVLNGFENGIREYTMNTTIKYVTIDRLKKIGLI